MLVLILLFYKNPSNNFLEDMVCEDVFPLQSLSAAENRQIKTFPWAQNTCGFF